MTSEVKVSSKYQVVIPREIREKMGLERGDELTVELDGETITMRKKPDSFTAYTQGLHSGVWADTEAEAYLRRMREEWERRPKE